MKHLIEKAKAAAEAAAAEGRALNDDERALVEQAIAGAKAVKADAELMKAVDALGSELAEVKPEATTNSARTPGEKMFADAAYKTWYSDATRVGSVDVKSLPNSPSVLVGGIKATLLGSSDTSAGAMISADRSATSIAFGRDITALNLITVGSTNSDLVEYAIAQRVANGQSVNGAGTVGEGSAAGESAISFYKGTAPVRTVSTFVPASTRALADAAQLATIADSFLNQAIQATLEDQVIAGDGEGENMTGILNVSGVQAQAYDTDLVTSIRKAIRKVGTVGNSRATAVLLNPEDNEKIDLLGGANTDYLFGGPAAASTPTVWGLPRVVSQAVPAGTAIVGAFNKAVLWERQGLTLATYPQHADYAIKGLVAVVASARAAFGVTHPEAFCTVDLTA